MLSTAGTRSEASTHYYQSTTGQPHPPSQQANPARLRGGTEEDVEVIDDGPQFKLMLYRAVKRFELDLAAWPRPPERAREDWGSYWQCRFEEILFRVGLGVRRLIDAAKLSIEVQGCPIEILHAPLLATRIPDALNYHRVDDFYNLQAAISTQVPLVSLCHAIVHSYVLVPRFAYSAMDGLRLEGFFLASDRSRRQGVYVVQWRHFVAEVVRPVVNDDVCSLVSFRTGQGDEIRIPLSNTNVTTEDRQRVLAMYENLSKDHAKAVKKFGQKWEETWGFPLLTKRP